MMVLLNIRLNFVFLEKNLLIDKEEDYELIFAIS